MILMQNDAARQLSMQRVFNTVTHNKHQISDVMTVLDRCVIPFQVLTFKLA